MIIPVFSSLFFDMLPFPSLGRVSPRRRGVFTQLTGKAPQMFASEGFFEEEVRRAFGGQWLSGGGGKEEEEGEEEDAREEEKVEEEE